MSLPNNRTPMPTVGILGDGQLAMMMAQAYQALGGRVAIFGSNTDAPAHRFADNFFVGDFNSGEDLLTFFSSVDVVTLENEFVNSELLIATTEKTKTPVLPDPNRYRLIEDKLSENHFFQNLGIPIADFFEVSDPNNLPDAPGYLKLAKGGYDGIGTYRVADKVQAQTVFDKISASGTVLFENEMKFVKELSLIAVANAEQIIFYPLVETHQEDGTCRYVTYPSGVDRRVEQQAQTICKNIMQALDTQGLFAFEFFLSKDNRLILNESAPRPHNSGHITLDLMDCSQFENHMRAVSGLPLKEPVLIKESATMINLLGTRDGEFEEQSVRSQLDGNEMTIKLYGKKRSRVKRKMGHINLWGNNQWQKAQDIVKNLSV